MTEQGVLPLPDRPPSHARADFLVSECNRGAFECIERWPAWPAEALVLYGPAGCGKTHLIELWRARSGAAVIAGAALARHEPRDLARSTAVAIDAAEGAPEKALLHLYNACGETGAALLVAARAAPARWPIALPDLASRLRAAPSVAIGLPDDGLLAALLAKHFSDRQVRVGPEVIAHIVARIERSFAAAAAAAERLDRLSYRERRPITLAIARQALAE